MVRRWLRIACAATLKSMEITLLVAAVFLAYANGANDNPKGVATLIGSRTTGVGEALAWATATTFAGCLGALFIGKALIATFSGKGLVPDAMTTDPGFLASVGLGAAITVALATRIGMPISTTHSLIGALVGAGWVWVGPELRVAHLGAVFILPLATSPLLALAITMPLYRAARSTRLRLGVVAETCICVGPELRPAAGNIFGRWGAAAGRAAATDSTVLHPDAAMTAAVTAESVWTVRTGATDDCMTIYRGTVLGFDAQWLLDRAHFVTAGAVGFARGLNDAPKIAAILLVARGISAWGGLMAVAVAMAAGGWLASRRVAATISYQITEMNAGQGFIGNLVTAVLVAGASWMGIPVSTTHVSVGALFGIGAVNGKARWATIGTIVSAWVTTLPVAAVSGALAAVIIRAWIA